MNTPVLDNLKNPSEIKTFSLAELRLLAKEIRIRISAIVSEVGGHLGPNLGAVELIIGCHYVFNLNKDRLVFDVGHQVYPHKLLTGRHKRFRTLRQKEGISGYPHQRESRYDVFRGGHASTAVSTALGLQCGYAIAAEQHSNHVPTRSAQSNHSSKKDDAIYVVALVGDGAMTGGMTFEGLNHTGYLSKPLIVILNDNSMSISPTVGALSKTFNYFRHLDIYRNIRDKFREKIVHIPKVGQRVRGFTEHVLKDLQEMVSPSQIFTSLGFEYMGPIDGHNLRHVIKSLKLAKKLNKPVLIHAVTEKGIGFTPEGKIGKSIIGPHALSGKQPPSKSKLTQRRKIITAHTTPVSYSKVFAAEIINLAKRNPKIVAITAAMSEGTGLLKFAQVFPNQYFDVGICEAHATGFSAGLAASHCRPVFAVYSTFLQRAFDQIFHDIILQESLSVVFCIDRAGLVGDDGPSHHGLYDIAYLRIFPNMILMAPKDALEFKQMLAFAVKQKSSVALRYPKAVAPPETYFADVKPAALRLGVAEVLSYGKKVCIWAYGSLVHEASVAIYNLEKQGIRPTLVNARFAKPLDLKLLRATLQRHKVILTLEEASCVGGFGSAILEQAQSLGFYKTPIKICGTPDALVEHASRVEQLKSCRLDTKSIEKTIKDLWKKF
ncbi:1-deoxy-D-xylulose-5-phosphate synthase [Spirochaetota bacterium]|nr:1-deoxy-D-xylulose-5-phosphate synthase [Spirochaetota bacterium]